MLLVGGSSDRMVGDQPVLDGVALPLKEQVCSLEVLLEPSLSLDAQVASARSAFYQLWLVSQLRPYLDRDNLASVVHALVTSKLDYCGGCLCGAAFENGSEAAAHAKCSGQTNNWNQ